MATGRFISRLSLAQTSDSVMLVVFANDNDIVFVLAGNISSRLLLTIPSNIVGHVKQCDCVNNVHEMLSWTIDHLIKTHIMNNLALVLPDGTYESNFDEVKKYLQTSTLHSVPLIWNHVQMEPLNIIGNNTVVIHDDNFMYGFTVPKEHVMNAYTFWLPFMVVNNDIAVTYVMLGDFIHPSVKNNVTLGMDVPRPPWLGTDVNRGTIMYDKIESKDAKVTFLHLPNPKCSANMHILRNGNIVNDKTPLGMVRLINVDLLATVIVMGHLVLDRVRFDRALVPFSLSHNESPSFIFEKSTVVKHAIDVHMMQTDGQYIKFGRINLLKKKLIKDDMWLKIKP